MVFYLLWAIANAHNHVAMELINQGAAHGQDLNIQDNWPMKNAAIHLAVAKGYTVRSKDGQMLKFSNLDLVKKMVELDADLNLQNGLGNTPLHLAHLRRDTETIQFLLENGAKTGIKNLNGETPQEMSNKNYEAATKILWETVSTTLQ